MGALQKQLVEPFLPESYTKEMHRWSCFFVSNNREELFCEED
jgi:hypothetical protein